MRASDLVSLQQLYLQSRLYAFTWLDPDKLGLDDFERDTKGERVWVAELDDQIAGFVSAWESENYIHNLFVLPQFCRRGIGTQLIKTCLENLGRPARLKCISENAAAIEFYQAKGWRSIAEGNGSEGEYQLMQYSEA